MRIKLNHLKPLLAAGAAAVAIAAAPTAAAEESCSGAVCQSPGNVQINDAPPVQYAPQYPDFGSLLFHHGGPHR